MPFGTITSTSNTFGSISGDVGANVPGTLTGSVGVPGPAGAPGVGVPAGGLTGQILLKASDLSYDTVWADNSAETLAATVRNETGATLSKGTVVYISGAAGNKALVSKASAASESSSSKTFAILAQDIPNNQNGTAVTVGLLRGLNTLAFTPGANLWLSTTAGEITQTVPVSPNHAVFLGNAVRIHATQGEIEVRIQNGLELGELHDVLITAPTNGQVLKYDAAQSLWVNGTDVGGVAWGGITGVLSSQTDLWSALGSKYDASNPAGYITASALAPYLLSSTAASTYFTIASAAGKADLASPVFTGDPRAPTPATADNDTSIATTAFVKAQGYLTSAPVTSVAGKTGDVSLVVSDVSGAADLAGATFTGKVNTIASATGTAGLNLPHGAAPTTPVNGDLWTTTGGLFMRQNGSTQQYVSLGETQTISGNKTFSNANVSLGTSTGAGTINVGTGATISGSTKTINIGTGGVSGSTTAINLGTTSGGGATITLQNNTTVGGTLTVNGASLTLGSSTAAGTIGIGTGATVSGSTRTINIGTASAAGSTNAINIGGGSGTSTTTLQGITNGVTAAVDTNTTQLATTAYVVGQGYLKSATASSTYAPLASPTFTGTPSLPTGTIAVTQSPGNNTTAVATTAFVTAAVPTFATNAQVVATTSTNTTLAPSNQGFILSNPRLRSLAFINGTSISGSGTLASSTPQTFSRQAYLASLATGRSCFIFGAIGSTNAGFGTSTTKADQVDFSKKIWLSGYACMGWTGGTSYIGDANTTCRITLGGYSANATGDMNLRGIGLKKVGGASSFVILTVHNGTTYTEVTSSVTVPDGGGINWQIYSDGTGNVTLYINGTQAATTTAGPTTATASGNGCYREQVEAVATPTVRQAMNCNGGWFYSE